MCWTVCHLACWCSVLTHVQANFLKESIKPVVSYPPTGVEAYQKSSPERSAGSWKIRISHLIPNKLSRKQLRKETGRHEDTDAPLWPPSEAALILPAASFLGHMAPAGNLLGCLHVPHCGVSWAGHEAAHPTGSTQSGGGREAANYHRAYRCSQEYQRVINGI